jgi:hypothetical protein
MAWRVGTFSALVLAVVAAGCGGPITDDELERGITTLSATAAEGQLVARGIAQDRTKTTFVRVQLRQLGEDAEHEAEKLSDAEDRPSNARFRQKAISIAMDINDAMGALQVRPRDRTLGADVARRLAQLRKRADALAEAL